MLPLLLSFTGAIVASSVSEISHGIVSMRLNAKPSTPKSAREVLSAFQSIPHGAWISVKEFREAFPLKELILRKAHLFFRADGTDPLAELAAGFMVEPNVAVDKFLAHNYNELNIAIDKLLKSSNDIVIATLFAYPFDVANKDLMRPIATLLDEYARFRSTPCLIEHLPTVFADPAVYRTYFTPTDGWRVTVNEEVGYMTVVPEASFRQTSRRSLSSSTFHTGWVAFNALDPADHTTTINAVLDVRKSCAVRVNQPYSLVDTILPNWLILRDESSGVYLVWRDDSPEPLELNLRGQGSFEFVQAVPGVIASRNSIIYNLPVDHGAPFIPESFTYEEYYPKYARAMKGRHSCLDIKAHVDDSFMIPTETGARLKEGFRKAISDILSKGLKMSMERIEGMAHVLLDVPELYSFIKLFALLTEGNVWLLSIEIREKYNLKSNKELAELIIKHFKQGRRLRH